MSYFPSIFVPLPFSLCLGSTAYVFPFRVMFFYLVTRGWIIDITLGENLTNQSNNQSTWNSTSCQQKKELDSTHPPTVQSSAPPGPTLSTASISTYAAITTALTLPQVQIRQTVQSSAPRPLLSLPPPPQPTPPLPPPSSFPRYKSDSGSGPCFAVRICGNPTQS